MAKSNSTQLIVRAQCQKAFNQIDEGDMKLQHPTPKTLLETGPPAYGQKTLSIGLTVR
jgi:hypothetical protein